MDTYYDNTEISSLIRLLDDRDGFVRDRVRERLIELGPTATPYLENACREENLDLRRQVQMILECIAPQELEHKLRELTKTGLGEDLNLESGVSLLVQYGHPQADTEYIHETLNTLALEFSQKVEWNSPPIRIVRQLCDFLFREKGFSGNKDNYFDPDNSYLDTVLKRRIGIPISLSALCIFIGERLDLPIVGVGLPCHFIAKYHTPEDSVFFDPFNFGRVLSGEDCAELVRGFGLEFEERFLEPVSQREILIRMVHNLIMVYNRKQDEEKTKQLTEFSKILMNRP